LLLISQKNSLSDVFLNINFFHEKSPTNEGSPSKVTKKLNGWMLYCFHFQESSLRSLQCPKKQYIVLKSANRARFLGQILNAREAQEQCKLVSNILCVI